MTEFICPNCRGGFPEPIEDGLENAKRCPWCGENLDGSYEPPETPIISKTVSDDDQSSGLIDTLFR